MHEIFSEVTVWYMSNINYWTVILLMTIESSFIPFPSEIVVPPAGYKAAQGELNLYLVMLAGTVGSILGALFNYYISLYLGRKVIYSLAETKIVNLMGINRASIEKSEKFFIKYGKQATLIGRLVPGIRQLISVPAGLARMNMRDFLIYTFIGSAIWNVILAYLGYYLYTQKELLELYYVEMGYAMVGVAVLFVAWIVFKTFRKKKETPTME